MFQLFLLSIFVSLSKQKDCITKTFIDNPRYAYPKPGAFCTSPEHENRWRGELIYEYLEDSSGIRVKWKHILQRPDCSSVNLHFYVDNVFFSPVTQHNSKHLDWVEIRVEKTFELKIQAIYRSDPKCFEASRTIKMDTESSSTEQVEIVTPLADVEPKEETTTQAPDGTIIFAVSAGGSALVLVLIIAIALCLRRRSQSSPRNSPEEVDENHMYGTYGYGDDPDDPDYITAEDSNPYYG